MAQWLLSYHPAGKTSLKSSLFNVPGRLGWCAMEIIGPLNLLYILYFTLDGDLSVLPLANQLATALYVIHYFNRALVSPFLAAPSMSPIHVSIVAAAMAFNWVNSACLAGWVLGYRLDIGGFENTVVGGNGDADAAGGLLAKAIPFVGLGLFVLGMVGNIYSERALFRLRRKEGDKRSGKKNDNTTTTTNSDGSNNKYSKVYVIPPKKGVFRYILYPHYAFEWIEWLGFTLVGTAIFPAGSTMEKAAINATAPSIKLAPWLVPVAIVADKLRVPLPLPALVFVVNAVANMLPHARWGRKWYVGKFGEEAVGNRGVALPGCPWM